MNIELLNQMILETYVRVNKHPEQELFIYNYTAKAQYNRVWNEITLQCRGLILDGEGKVVARPFPKFFNLGEMEDQVIPALPFEIYEKMDGSLGITYWVDGEVYIATRGSFISEQSIKANELLNTRYATAKAQLKEGVTYLFEIIYPANRIVVDYGAEESLTLLAIVDNNSGEELPLEEIGFPIVEKYDGLNAIHQLQQLELENKEGFVIRFQNNYRLKVKFEEYTRIHRIVTRVSSVSIWEYLKTGLPMDEVIERVPDEFYEWVKKTKARLEEQYLEIEAKAKREYQAFPTRKETALYFQTCTYSSVLFQMLDGKSYEETIWRMIRPIHEKPFKAVEE